MVKKVIMNLNSSNASGPDYIPVLVLKNCEPELIYVPAELFNKCLKKSCFPDGWKVSLVVPVSENVGERSTAKNYCRLVRINFSKLHCEKLYDKILLVLASSDGPS